MTRYLRVIGDCVFERGPCGSLRCYHGEAAEVMRLVLRYSRIHQAEVVSHVW